jgi:hypothetical protein
MTAPSDPEPEGPTEFSWGRGLQPPISQGAVPTPWEEHRAVLASGKGYRSEDPSQGATFEDYIREP